MEIKIDLDYKYLSTLSPKEYWEFVDKCTKELCNMIILAQRDYCKKKGWDYDKLTLLQMDKMSKAVNQRKKLKQLSKILLNLQFYPIFGENWIKNNGGSP